MPPQWSDFILPSYIPHIEFDVFESKSLNVETDGWNGGDVGVELELVKNCC